MRRGASPSTSATSRTRTKEGGLCRMALSYLPRQFQQHHGNNDLLVERHLHAIAPRVRLRLVHHSSAVTKEAQSNIALQPSPRRRTAMWHYCTHT